MVIDVALVVLGAVATVLVAAGRLASRYPGGGAVGLVAAAAVALALAVFDFRFLGLAILCYWLWHGARYVVRWLTMRAAGREEHAAEPGVDRSKWPLSGPIRRYGPVGVLVMWNATQLLALLNPFLMIEWCRQVYWNAYLSARAARSGDDGRGYRTRTVYTLPFAGEWLVVNGGHTPQTSHSWSILGQRFALDFVQANEAFKRHRGRGTRADEYICYGREIVAAADGTVVRTESRVRQAPLGWAVCDFMARSVVGNHVLVEHADGEFALYAHLIRGSVAVAPGDRVSRAQVLGRCGHTGNSTEPHLHFHLQDSADLFGGMGLPVRFSSLLVDGKPADTMLLSAGNRVCPRRGGQDYDVR